MYWCAHKTATLTSIQHTVPPPFIEIEYSPISFRSLLYGPPGLGKTTLAHVVANHAGYNVVEINASDDREYSANKIIYLCENGTETENGNFPNPSISRFFKVSIFNKNLIPDLLLLDH